MVRVWSVVDLPHRDRGLDWVAIDHPPDRTGFGAHQDCLGGHVADFTLDTGHNGPIGHTSRGKDHVRSHHIIARIDLVEIRYARFCGPATLIIVALPFFLDFRI